MFSFPFFSTLCFVSGRALVEGLARKSRTTSATSQYNWIGMDNPCLVFFIIITKLASIYELPKSPQNPLSMPKSLSKPYPINKNQIFHSLAFFQK